MKEGPRPTQEEMGVRPPEEQLPGGGEAQAEAEASQDLADYIAQLYEQAGQDLPEAQGASAAEPSSSPEQKPEPEPEPEAEPEASAAAAQEPSAPEPVSAPETEAESTPTPTATATPEPTAPDTDNRNDDRVIKTIGEPDQLMSALFRETTGEADWDAYRIDTETQADKNPAEDDFEQYDNPTFDGPGVQFQVDTGANTVSFVANNPDTGQEEEFTFALTDFVDRMDLVTEVLDNGTRDITIKTLKSENAQFARPLSLNVNEASLQAAIAACQKMNKEKSNQKYFYWDSEAAKIPHEYLDGFFSSMGSEKSLMLVDYSAANPRITYFGDSDGSYEDATIALGQLTLDYKELKYAMSHRQTTQDGKVSLIHREFTKGRDEVRVRTAERILLSDTQFTKLQELMTAIEQGEQFDWVERDIREENWFEYPADDLNIAEPYAIPKLDGGQRVIIKIGEKGSGFYRKLGLDELQYALQSVSEVKPGVYELQYRHDAHGRADDDLVQAPRKIIKMRLSLEQLNTLQRAAADATQRYPEASHSGPISQEATQQAGNQSEQRFSVDDLRGQLGDLLDSAKGLLSRVRGSRQAANSAEGASPQPQPEAQPAQQPAAEQTTPDEIPEIIRETRQAVDANPGDTPDQFTLQEDPEVSDKQKLGIEVAEKVLKQTLFKKREQRERVRTSFLDHLTRQGLSYTETGGEHAGEHVTVLTADQLRAVLTDPRFLNDVGWHLVQREIKNNLRRRNYADATKALAEVIADRFSDDSRDKKEFITELEFAIEEFFTLELPYVEYPGLLTLPAQEKAAAVATAAQKNARKLGIPSEQAADAASIIRMAALDVEAGESQLTKIAHTLRGEFGMSDARIALLLKLASEAKLGRNPEAQPAPTEQTESQQAQERMTEITDALAEKLMQSRDEAVNEEDYRTAVDQLKKALKERLRQGGQLTDRASVDQKVAEVRFELKALPDNESIPWLNKDEYAQAKAIFGNRKNTVRLGLMKAKVKLG